MTPTQEATAGRGLGRFLPVWLGQVVSVLGIQLCGFALGVEVFQETGSVTNYAWIGLSSILPLILFSPLAGVAADRFDRRWILILASAGSAATFLWLSHLLEGGRAELWQIYALVAVSASCSAFVWPTLQSSVTLLVGKEHLERAAGMVQMGMALSRIAGPILAGALLGKIEVRGIVLLTFTGYLLNSVILLLIRFPKPEATAAGEEARAAGTSVFRQTLSSLRFIHARPGLWQLMKLFFGVNFAAGMVVALLTPLVLGFSTPLVLGLVMSIAAAGALVGGILMSVWGGSRGRRIVTVLYTLGGLGGILLLGGLRPSAALVAAAAFCYMFGIPVISGSVQALWQSKVPADVQGRVFAASQMVAGAGSPLALAVAGPLADHVFEPLLMPGGALAGSVGRLLGVGTGRGIGLMLVLLGFFLLALTVLSWLKPSLRRLEEELPDAGEETSQDAGSAVRPPPAPSVGPLGRAPATALAVVLGVLAVLVLAATRPPQDPGDTDFSLRNAERHLEAIAREPHPVGSEALGKVRDYLLDELRRTGLETEVQRTTGIRRFRTLGVVAHVENVLARLPGSASGRGAVLLVAHYDSKPMAPGASDDGAAVAVLLETARVLRQGPALRNDVLFLFSDAEEFGLQGARAFVERHPWAGEVAVVLNFEARGHGGPVYMFQTGYHNRDWIPGFAGVARPSANSLMNQIYQRLPNDTDFTVFRDAGYAGFNFAFIEGLTHYHSALDRPEEVDRGSLAHEASYALALARRFGNADLSGVKRRPPSPQDEAFENRTYFDLAGCYLVHYPQELGWLLLMLAGLAFFGLLADALRRKRMSLFGFWQGFLAFLGQLVAIPVAITLIWLVLRDTASLAILEGSTPGAWRYMIAFVTLAVAAVGVLHLFLRAFASTLDLAAGAYAWWWILALLTSGPLLPVDGNYLFVWPLLGALPAFAYLVRVKPGDQRPWVTVAILAGGALPAVVITFPFVATLYVGLQGLAQLGGLALVLVVLVTGLGLPFLELLSRAFPRWPAALAAAGALGLVLALWNPGTPHRDVRPSSVLYAYDADSGERDWFSLDAQPDEWTRSFGFTDQERKSIEPFFPFQATDLLHAEAAAAEVPEPVIEVAGESGDAARRRVDLRLRAGTGARSRLLRFTPAAAVAAVELDGVPISLGEMAEYEASALLELPVRASEEKLSLQLVGNGEVAMTLVEQYEGLPEVPGVEPRPPGHLPPAPRIFLRSDVTLVRRSLTLPGEVEPTKTSSPVPHPPTPPRPVLRGGR